MAHVHSRMPAIVEEADWLVWLGETEGDPAALPRPAQEDLVRLWTVSRAVNHSHGHFHVKGSGSFSGSSGDSTSYVGIQALSRFHDLIVSSSDQTHIRSPFE
jgi:hypothetical protein